MMNEDRRTDQDTFRLPDVLLKSRDWIGFVPGIARFLPRFVRSLTKADRRPFYLVILASNHLRGISNFVANKV